MLGWGFVGLMLNYRRNFTFIGLGYCSKTLFRSTHIAEEHLFSMFPSILTFNFDLLYKTFLGIFLDIDFWTPLPTPFLYRYELNPVESIYLGLKV